MPDIKVYGADWCPLTRAAKTYLRSRNIDFQYVDVEQDAKAAQWVKDQNGGKEKKPTIDIDGQVLSEPTDEELEAALTNAGR